MLMGTALQSGAPVHFCSSGRLVNSGMNFPPSWFSIMNSAWALIFSPALTSFGISIRTGATKRALRITLNRLFFASSLFSRRRRSAAMMTSELVIFSVPNSGMMR